MAFSLVAENIQVGGMLTYRGTQSLFSIDVRKDFGKFSVGLTPGFAAFIISKPEISMDSAEQTVDLTGNLNCLSFEAGVYYNWLEQTNMKAYSGVSYLFGSDIYDGTDADVSFPLLNIKIIVLGADLMLPEYDNLILSGSIGGEIHWLASSSVEVDDYHKAKLNSSLFNTFGEIAARIAF
ncbi:MAG: hypothetical protein LKE40_12040 [Spirochaetia bacterium]|nr:hypothetical protein [Spirochaetia bacterium]